MGDAVTITTLTCGHLRRAVLVERLQTVPNSANCPPLKAPRQHSNGNPAGKARSLSRRRSPLEALQKGGAEYGCQS